MDYEADKKRLEEQFFTDVHALIGSHRSKEENIAWWGDTVTLEGTYTSQELLELAKILERYREAHIALRNEID